ncbi:MAG TPA: ATP-grasp domain-containing protein [Gemmataceae bacterium]|jgi:predicted ATP-grasp superfamily ATP-dependent carboligase|nr:ATP-grasp domain-containing protein [Gemmataceae bacterium]
METVMLVGASVRAAAFSALRAGLRPWAIDLFADRDLAAACPVRRIPARRYPAGIAEMIRQAPPGPWLYTGALENRPELIEEIARERPLWGNDAACLRRVRDPFALAAALGAAGIPCPAVRPAGERPAGAWLSKPRAGGGGAGIRFATGRLRDHARRTYLQEFVEGESRSGVFVADVSGCRLLGVTRQLIGIDWLHAGAFRYAGSIGPLPIAESERSAWRRLGSAVASFADLRGIFGVDAVIRDGVPWPVEVNPRYTASVEVIEYGSGVRAMQAHRRALGRDVPSEGGPGLGTIIGKAIWYAPRPIVFAAEGPWDAVLQGPIELNRPPAFADIPAAGEQIAAGRPVLTFFATAATTEDCVRRLRATADELDRLLPR